MRGKAGERLEPVRSSEGRGKRRIHRHLEGDLSRGQPKNMQGGVTNPGGTEHNDWPVIKKYLSGIKLTPKNSPWTWSDGFQGTSYW